MTELLLVSQVRPRELARELDFASNPMLIE